MPCSGPMVACQCAMNDVGCPVCATPVYATSIVDTFAGQGFNGSGTDKLTVPGRQSATGAPKNQYKRYRFREVEYLMARRYIHGDRLIKMQTSLLFWHSVAAIELRQNASFERYRKDRAGNSHQATRRQERRMQRFMLAQQPQEFLSLCARVTNSVSVRYQWPTPKRWFANHPQSLLVDCVNFVEKFYCSIGITSFSTRLKAPPCVIVG